MEKGLKNTKSLIVTESNTAKALGSGTLEVFSTPIMIALLEGCCAESVENKLGEDITSVGTHLDIKHLSPSPIGSVITCTSELIEFDGRKLIFNVEINDQKGTIGKGTHERVTVKKEKFMQKALNKLE